MLTCQINHSREPDRDSPKCSGLKQCSHCETEFQIDARELGHQGFTIVITKWWDLCPGISPIDLQYKRHHRPEGYASINSRRYPKLEFEKGTIRDTFEPHQKFSVDSFLEANRRPLLFYVLFTTPNWADMLCTIFWQPLPPAKV
jgi:hypothetical protein